MEYVVFLNFLCWKHFSRCYGVLVSKTHDVHHFPPFSLSCLFFTSSWHLSSPLSRCLSCRRFHGLVLSSYSLSCVVVVFTYARGVAGCARRHKNIKMERKMLREHEKTRRVFIKSIGDEEHTCLVKRVVPECRQEDQSKWSYSSDETERSLNTSQKWRLGARFTEFVRRSVKRIFPL